MKQRAWDGVIFFPYSGRSLKPRTIGLTMVIDKGLGKNVLKDLIQSSGDYVDLIKLTFGTSAFFERSRLEKKIRLITSNGIDVMPGGTFFEVAVWQDRLEAYFERAKDLGFTAVEISDGTIEISPERRRAAIRKAVASGLKVVTEVGKKDPREEPSPEIMHRLISEDASAGAFKVIIEAREAGRGVGIFDGEGKTCPEKIERILAGVADPDILIWEAPQKNQQQDLILRFGPNVNLGNIPPDEILALEALRQGLRGDTLKQAYLQSSSSRS